MEQQKRCWEHCFFFLNAEHNKKRGPAPAEAVSGTHTKGRENLPQCLLHLWWWAYGALFSIVRFCTSKSKVGSLYSCAKKKGKIR